MSFESLYSGQFTSSTQLIKPNYLVILPTPNKKRMRLLVVSSLVVVASIWRVLSSRCKAFFPASPPHLQCMVGFLKTVVNWVLFGKKWRGKHPLKTALCWKLPQSGFWIIVFVSYGRNLKRSVRFLLVGEMLYKVKLWGRHGTVFKRRLVRRSLCFTGFDKTLTPS